MFRLTNEPGGLSLSCSPEGLFLAGVPLLRRTQAGFESRPAPEIAALMKAAYGPDGDPVLLQSSLGSIARALNGRDFGLAAIAAVQTRTPELSRGAAARLAKADSELAKYNFNPDEPRDWHGRWTTGGSLDPASLAASEIEGDRRLLSDGEGGGRAKESTSLKQPFEREHENLGAVDVAIGDDIMRSIVKNACIAECSESNFPTNNYGWKFFNCVNECMKRHGHDPFLFRLS
jgi:hypothetical protein